METTLENDMEDIVSTINEESVDKTDNFDEIIKFRDQLFAREILSCGVGVMDKIVHFGSGYKNSLLWDYLSSIKTQNLVENFGVIYTAVDADAHSINEISRTNAENATGIDVRLINNTMQSFLDTNTDEFDWSIVTGIFDKNLYGEEQFKFIDTMITNLLNISREGLIFTFDSSRESDESYNINLVIDYLSSIYNRYRINRINEENYVICIYKYYHSIIPQ